jgi:hypothetical protein
VAFAPTDRPRIAVAMTGALAAIQDASGIAIVELPGGAAVARIDGDPGAEVVEVGWLGVPPRLLVLSRYADHTVAQLFDPRGLRAAIERVFDARVRLRATVGAHALVVAAAGAALVTARADQLAVRALPLTAAPVAAGAVGSQLVLALAAPGRPAGSIVEHWDPGGELRARVLTAPAELTRLGGNGRWLWMTTQQHAGRLVLVPFDAPGEPAWLDLGEDIAHVAGHPFADVVACIGARTGRLYLVTLDAAPRARAVEVPGFDRVDAAAIVVGAQLGVLVAQGQRPIAVLEVPGDLAASADAAVDGARVAQGGRPSARLDALGDLSALAARPAQGHFAWRDDALGAAWRDDVARWARAVEAGAPERGPPTPRPILALSARLELPLALVPALVLLYGAHLDGADGASPRALASVLAGSWSEALGRGQLAAHGAASYAQSRVHLADVLARALDDRPPKTGALVGPPGAHTLLASCVIVAAADQGLEAGARDAVPWVAGAILAGHATADPDELALEARARGAAPMWRVAAAAAAPTRPAILVAASEAIAQGLELPRLG